MNYYNDIQLLNFCENKFHFLKLNEHKGDRYYMPTEYYLGSTPLNEALVVLNKMIPIFKDKNRIEKID